jgi:hypothetical protein
MCSYNYCPHTPRPVKAGMCPADRKPGSQGWVTKKSSSPLPLGLAGISSQRRERTEYLPARERSGGRANLFVDLLETLVVGLNDFEEGAFAGKVDGRPYALAAYPFRTRWPLQAGRHSFRVWLLFTPLVSTTVVVIVLTRSVPLPQASEYTPRRTHRGTLAEAQNNPYGIFEYVLQ